MALLEILTAPQQFAQLSFYWAHGRLQVKEYELIPYTLLSTVPPSLSLKPFFRFFEGLVPRLILAVQGEVWDLVWVRTQVVEHIIALTYTITS